jgi:hypothetical protein
MDIGAILVGLGLLVIVAAFVARPLFDRGSRNGDVYRLNGDPAAQLSHQRDAIYALIRELDGDFETGKVTEQDYRVSRERYVADAAAILKQLDAYAGEDRPTAIDAEIERRVLELRKAPAAVPHGQSGATNLFCTQCGQPADPADRFCAQCGASLRGSAV